MAKSQQTARFICVNVSQIMSLKVGTIIAESLCLVRPVLSRQPDAPGSPEEKGTKDMTMPSTSTSHYSFIVPSSPKACPLPASYKIPIFCDHCAFLAVA
jgi:hypothetical protein